MDSVLKMIIEVIILCVATGAALTEAPRESTGCVRVTDGAVLCEVTSLPAVEELATTVRAAGASRLQLSCGPDSSAVSLRPHHFDRLQGLIELTIIDCGPALLPADTFAGMRGLETLTLRFSDNNPTDLELSSGAFDGLKELHRLDLGRNGIRKIPSDLFCALDNLISLNLTGNKIKYVDELGFGHRCGSTVQAIDLSHNRIATVPPDSEVVHFRRLTQLYLQNNDIHELSADVFADLLSLKVLNISNNALASVPPDLFSSTREIREIYMQNNLLETLPKGIFNRLEQLLVLNLSGNKLSSDQMDEGMFRGLIRLIVLDLSHNSVARVSANLFRDLFFLQILDLRNNSITSIEDNAFLPLFNLHTLNLGENKLLLIKEQSFNGLFILNKLTLNNNLINKVADNVFKNCSDLKELDLSSNRLTKIPRAIIQLSVLKSLDLGENLINEISNHSFQNLSQLTGLRLIDNQIGNLSAGMFRDLPNLQVLNLAKNKIQSIERETFQRNTQLEAVRLDGNFISDINGVFVSLTKLLWLNLSENHLVWFDYAFIPENLKWLDIHANFIEILGNYYKIKNNLHVKTFDASHNRLVALSALAIPNSVELLFINNNFISNVDTDTFSEKKNLTRVDMYANEIEHLDLNSLRVSRVPADRPLPQFYVSGNPFRCDCLMKWLLVINNNTSRHYPRVMDIDSVICKESYVRGAKYSPIVNLKVNDFLCRYETYCAESCKCCERGDCDCRIVCPKNCSCYHDSNKSVNVVDCSALMSPMVPQSLPVDATHLYLDGNLYIDLNRTFFIKTTNVRVLYLNSSSIENIYNNTFADLYILEVLHLEQNKLTKLQGLEFVKLSNLRKLFLHDNNIEHISNETFSLLNSLEVLRLDGNRLTNYALWHLDNNKKLKSLFIGKNYWSCQCKYLQGFLMYLSQNVEKVTDVGSLFCTNDPANLAEKKPLQLNGTTCTDVGADAAMSAFLVSNNLPLLASVLTGIMLVLLILALVFTFRYTCRMWLYSNCGIKLSPLAEAFDEADKLYDAYICYSPKDEEFAIDTLARELETGYPSYHLCLHYRDVPQFEATYAQFPDLVVEASDASRRIIVILTKNFIRTEWSHLEFRQALQRALQKNPHKLIVVGVGAIPRDAESKPYFKTGLEITWKEKRFWERLRYAMPSSKRRSQKLKRLNYGRQSNNYTMDASVMNGTCQTLCGKSANSAERSPCDRPLSEHIYSTIDSDYSSADRAEYRVRSNHPNAIVLEHTVQTYLV